MTDPSDLAMQNLDLASTIDGNGQLHNPGEIMELLMLNAETLENMATRPAAEPEGDNPPVAEFVSAADARVEIAALRGFYDLFTPVRHGRDLAGLDPKMGPPDMARQWLSVKAEGRNVALAEIVNIAVRIAETWEAVTPDTVKPVMPETVRVGRIMGPASRNEGDDEKVVYKPLSGADLTSFQQAQLRLSSAPPDLGACDDNRIRGLIFALVMAVTAAEPG